MLSREAKAYYRSKEYQITREKKRIAQSKLSKINKHFSGYDPLELICSKHNVQFIRWIYHYPDIKANKTYSHGCPVCVGLIRAKVQMERNRCCTIQSNGRKYPRNVRIPNGKTKRGRPKTSINANIIEARNGIE